MTAIHSFVVAGFGLRSAARRLLSPRLLALAILFVLAGCSGNPEARKLQFVRSGDEYVGAGKIAEAIIEYRSAIQIDARYADARAKLGAAYARIGDARGALDEYVRAADLLPARADIQVSDIERARVIAKLLLIDGWSADRLAGGFDGGQYRPTMLEQQEGPDTAGRAMSRWLNRTVGNQQLGFMLAFLGRKVLGQYDVSLLAAGPTRGRLNFVEQNNSAKRLATVDSCARNLFGTEEFRRRQWSPRLKTQNPMFLLNWANNSCITR